MGETEAISKMADLLATNLLNVFKWKRTGPLNQNWSCVNSSAHNNRTQHPSDVVYYYDEPYSSLRTYVNIDLKSYAKGTIKTGKINDAIHNLIQSVECANGSEDWQNLYTHQGKSFQVHGLLFIYNHDGAYDSDFHNLLMKCEIDTKNMPSCSVIGVWEPERVCYLNTIANDITINLARAKCDTYEFFYPDLSRKKRVVAHWEAAASFEMLSSPMILIKYEHKAEDELNFGIFIYYSRRGETREEFAYIIEYLFNYQLFQNASKIEIRLANPSPNATSQFEKAKEQYIEEKNDSAELEAILSKVSASTVTQVIPQFSEIEIGMRDV